MKTFKVWLGNEVRGTFVNVSHIEPSETDPRVIVLFGGFEIVGVVYLQAGEVLAVTND